MFYFFLLIYFLLLIYYYQNILDNGFFFPFTALTKSILTFFFCLGRFQLFAALAISDLAFLLMHFQNVVNTTFWLRNPRTLIEDESFVRKFQTPVIVLTNGFSALSILLVFL